MENDYYGFVYITTNILDGKRYIGQRSLSKQGHADYLGSGKALLRAIRKHGRENFTREVVYYAATKDALDQAERDLIAEHDAVASREFYNLVPGGHGCSLGFKGKTHSPETREKMRQAAIGHPVSEYTRKRVSETPKNWKQMVKTRRTNGSYRTGCDHARAVRILYKGHEYPTITAAVKATGDAYSRVYRHSERLTE